MLVLSFREGEYARLGGLFVPRPRFDAAGVQVAVDFEPVEVKVSVERPDEEASRPVRLGFEAPRDEVPITRHAKDGRCLTGPKK